MASTQTQNHSQSSTLNLVHPILQEIGDQGIWSLSSSKPGNGLEQLRDESIDSFWQSDGAQPHLINIQFVGNDIVSLNRFNNSQQQNLKTNSIRTSRTQQQNLSHNGPPIITYSGCQKKISEIHLYTSFRSDESYTPSQVAIRIGSCLHDLRQIGTQLYELNEPEGWAVLRLARPEIYSSKSMHSQIQSKQQLSEAQSQSQGQAQALAPQNNSESITNNSDLNVTNNSSTTNQMNFKQSEPATSSNCNLPSDSNIQMEVENPESHTQSDSVKSDDESEESDSDDESDEEFDEGEYEQLMNQLAAQDNCIPRDIKFGGHVGYVRASFLQIAILSNHQNGRDTHIRQIKIYGPKSQPIGNWNISNEIDNNQCWSDNIYRDQSKDNSHDMIDSDVSSISNKQINIDESNNYSSRASQMGSIYSTEFKTPALSQFSMIR